MTGDFNILRMNGNIQQDALSLFAYLEGFTPDGNQTDIDLGKCNAIISTVNTHFPHNGGVEKASPFKKAGYFLSTFVTMSPIISPFSSDFFGKGLTGIDNHQNAITGFELVCDSLHKATLIKTLKDKTEEEVSLDNRIILSKHSYGDTIEALSKPSTLATGNFRYISLLLEQMCYRFNPNAGYLPMDEE